MFLNKHADKSLKVVRQLVVVTHNPNIDEVMYVQNGVIFLYTILSYFF